MNTPSLADSHAVEAAFYAAFSRLDTSAMRALWDDSTEAACVHPGGDLLQGQAAIMQGWLDIFRGSKPPQLSYSLISAAIDNKLAVHVVRERLISADGRQASVIATNVYANTFDGWRMRMHHASLPLVEKAQPPAPPLH